MASKLQTLKRFLRVCSLLLLACYALHYMSNTVWGKRPLNMLFGTCQIDTFIGWFLFIRKIKLPTAPRSLLTY
ncbi:hypothetical protein BLS_005863 [Venturia inaequalis]|uniref:Uncharacterized protein n=1 Tax=Venturia inaequalis TaxID=5025 RepID=A0A8H3Z836_VENIN|nr:hypothetical protein BLS_005863 [Venturia inaequalis]KAE9989034.1 hypothetical protein EG328_003351 [Venturia inaequalis]